MTKEKAIKDLQRYAFQAIDAMISMQIMLKFPDEGKDTPKKKNYCYEFFEEAEFYCIEQIEKRAELFKNTGETNE